MHVHLISPSNEDLTYIKPLWVGTLAAHTPDDVELTFRDDGLEPVDLDLESDAPDLVGISVNSKTASRAYAIADAYRKRGSRVVLGGIHLTALPEEGLEHADAVLSGEAEGLRQEVIADAKAGKLGHGPLVDSEPRLLAHQPARARTRGAEDRRRGAGVAQAPVDGDPVRFVAVP
jgi:radical SAM superfamily enzyme YgiQ (UPF0313 family)